jgi:signal transduction histidine kinase
LIDNAIKHHDKEQGAITIRVEEVSHRYQFHIQDDGPGIAPKYHQKIFTLFQTLKPRDQVEGSGMGLALVAKLIQRVDGNIRLFSDPPHKRGSCFVFDWPKASLPTSSMQ